MQWRKQVGEMKEHHLERLIRDVGGAIKARLARGKVLPGLSPHHIEVEISPQGVPSFRLAGDCETVDLGPRKGSAPTLDPFYDAPEIVLGLCSEKDQRAHAERAAWWTLGRILQTVWLGKHVLSCLLMRTVDDRVQTHGPQARQLLQEKLPGVMHAGAVESMGRLPVRVERLLKGLLTRRVAARWDWIFLGRWVRGEGPPEYYLLPPSRDLFSWKERVFTIQDAAVELTRDAAEWADGIAQVLALEDPDTLGGFVCGRRGDDGLARRLRGLKQFERSASFTGFTPDLVHEMIGAVCLMILSQQAFRWRGEGVTPEFIADCIAESSDEEAFRALELMSQPKVVQQIHSFDGDTANRLGQLARTVEEIRSVLTERHRGRFEDVEERKKLWRASTVSSEVLLERQSRHRHRLARCESPHLDDLLKRDGLDRAELIVLDLTAREPKRFGYVSFVEDAERERAELESERQRLGDTLFWVRLERAVRAGWPLLAHWPLWTGLLTVFSLFGLVAKPGPGWALLAVAPPVLSGLARTFLQRGIARTICKRLPQARPWKWQDGARRCRREARALTGERHASRVLNRIALIEERLRELSGRTSGVSSFALSPHPLRVWTAAVLSWAIWGGVGGVFAHAIVTNPPSWSEIRLAWLDSLWGGDATDPASKPESSIVVDGAEETDPVFRALVSEERLLVSELDYAIERGNQLAERQGWRKGDPPITVRLQGLMKSRIVLYNPASQSLAEPEVYSLEAEPESGQVISVEGRQLIYRGR